MREIKTEILINAPPEKVYAALTESSNWGSWNPFIVRCEGRYAVGERLMNTLVLPDEKPMGFMPKVLKAEPGVELRWLGRLLMPGVFDGEHYFQMHAEGGGAGTRFVHGEIFRGILIWMLDFKKTEMAFNALNQGLKKKVESL